MDVVKKIIDEWDPLDLLSHAPADEYHSEIEKVRSLLDLEDNATELAEGIFQVFIESFGSENFPKSMAECEQIALALLAQKH